MSTAEMTTVELVDVVPGEAVAAAYVGCVVEECDHPPTALRRLAEAVQELEPLGAELLLLTADGLEQGEAQ